MAYHTGNGFVANLNNGNYPNLYPNTIIPPSTTQQEVGHLIRVPMAINVDAYPATNYSFRIEDEINHLPVIGAANAVPKYPFPTFPYSGFDFAGSITQQEMDLLANYGKVFFYEVNVYDKNTGAFVMTTMMHPQIETLPTGSKPVPNWQPVTEGPLSAGNHLKGNVPTLGDFDLYYCNVGRPDGTYFDFYGPKNGNISDSREVVFDVPMPLHEVQIDPNHKIVLDIAATGQTAWLNSALYLYVTSR